MRIIFAGTSEFARIQLSALLNTSHPLVAVYTQPDKPAGRGQLPSMSPVKQLALMHQLPIEQPLSFKDTLTVKKFADYEADLAIVAAYGLLLPPSILTAPRYGCINVHASLLPRWRGASPIQQAILAGDQYTGITLMQMDAGLDTGDILLQKDCRIDADETTETLQRKLADLGANLLQENISLIPKLTPTPQTHTDATYAYKITKSEALLDWHEPADQLARKIRAFIPWPITYSYIDHQPLRIWQAKPIPYNNSAAAGTIIAHAKEGILVATGEGALLLTEGQLAGKKRLSFKKLLQGQARLFAVGQCFNEKSI